MYARRARRARVARRPPRAVPSLSTERRPKRRRETRTTTGDGTRKEDEKERPPRRAMFRLSCGGKNHPRCTRAACVARTSPAAPRAPRPRSARSGDRREDARRGRRSATGREEDEERTTAARDVPAEVRRLEPPTRAPRGAGARARARLLAQRGRGGAARMQREESARLRLQRGARRARTNAEGRNDVSAVKRCAERSTDRKRKEGERSAPRGRSSDSRRSHGLGRRH